MALINEARLEFVRLSREVQSSRRHRGPQVKVGSYQQLDGWHLAHAMSLHPLTIQERASHYRVLLAVGLNSPCHNYLIKQLWED